jgi:hypothetical protein
MGHLSGICTQYDEFGDRTKLEIQNNDLEDCSLFYPFGTFYIDHKIFKHLKES